MLARMRILALTLFAILAAGCARSSQPPPPTTADGLLAVGTPAPDFQATAHDGTRVHLTELRGHPVVLYFYPKDDTPGCTKEACSFRDAWAKLKAAGVVVLGVSTQDNRSHDAFAQKYHLPFPLIPDEHGELAAKYLVSVNDGHARRVTYLISEDGRIAYVWPRVDVEHHAQQILDVVAPAGVK
jgi:peroxiredoxin Q/BCP